MGLDMYLNVRYYLPYNEQADTNAKFQEAWGKLAQLGHLKSVDLEGCYWRKANAIHNWFVKNVQNGVDDCASYEVKRAKLVELLNTCQQILKDHSLAEKLLPPVSGFFFGSTEIDEGYFEDLTHTHDQLTRLLNALPEDDFYTTVTYQSSW